MSKTIICSVGTSASKELGFHPKHLVKWVEEHSPLENAAEQMFESFLKFEPSEGNLTQHLSAEVHSLVRMGIERTDRVLLYASETSDGHCCALALKKYLQYYWSGITVETESISGLQVNDPEKFRTQGVVGFVKKIINAIDTYGNVILNPTGGYKALVPYTVLLGMIKGVKCNYIFEQSASLLELTPLPVEFQRSQFEAYKYIFEKIDRNSSISKQEWENCVPYEGRQLLNPLIECLGEDITFSAVGFLFFEEMRKRPKLVPFLSRQAINDCFDDIAQLDNCEPFDFLTRVCKSSDTLSAKIHLPAGQNLKWLKPGKHTTDRYLVSVEGWRLLVWRAIREDRVGKDYINKVKVNPDRDRRKYLPFMRMEYLNQ